MTKIKKVSDDRIGYIDVAKGILIYLVFLGHIVDRTSLTFNYIFAMHMSAFFFINGFLGGKAYNLNFSRFVLNRLQNYIVPYFVFALIGAMVHIANRDFTFVNMDMVKSLFLICMPDWLYIGAGWFLIASFWGNIFLYMWIKNFEKDGITLAEKIMIIPAIMYLALHILEYNIFIIPEYNRIPWRIDSAMMGFVFMLMGYYGRKLDIITKFQRKSNFFLSIYLFFCLVKVNGGGEYSELLL